ncbi:MAG: ATP-dependent exodnase (exonuclease V) alpha subunit - helicase superfamily I member [Algoriphagus sp. 32-45-6]|nr:MAG: ATP-dependent exodnase (exonuclease V) alpha subunit - helicase superfamily I member [Algoriphagus sp. 32-45-6]
MKSSINLLLFLYLSISLAWAQAPARNTAFTFGEELNFEVSYGWFNLAEAKMQVAPTPLREGEKVYYKIDAYGQTKGAATIFGRVNDNWGTHLDTGSLLPSMSYRHIEEGKYRKHEKVYFDQVNKKAKMELYDRENRALKEVKEFTLPGQVQDLVSGFYLLRTMNLNNLRKGQEILITGFFDKEIYNLNLIYEGTAQIETSLGKKETYIFSPRMPKNKLFRGEYPVKVWVTKDQNKIPVKIKANLFVGSLNIDIASAKGLKNN